MKSILQCCLLVCTGLSRHSEGKKIHLFPPGLNAKQALLKGGEACNPNW